MYKNVVFDLGNVLIRWDPRNLYRKIFDSPEEIEHFVTNICNLEWNEKFDEGLSFAQGVAELTTLHPHYKEQIQAYDTRWEETLGGAIGGTVQILERLKTERRVKLYALTNWSDEKFPVGLRKFPFLNLFDGIVVSGRIGLKKPDPRIYHYLCETFAAKPNESIFIDDLQRNIKASEDLGFTGIHFKSPEDLEKQLKALGLFD